MNILVSSLEKHVEIKQQILNLIGELPDAPLDDPAHPDDKISKTDWQLPDSAEKKYLSILKPIIVDHMSNVFKHFNPKGVEFGNFWFQQYETNDTHDWHIHRYCHWTSVYFLELPDNSIKTEVQDLTRTHLLDYNAKEGDIILFPSFLYHRSPVNVSKERKTIISFNTNFI